MSTTKRINIHKAHTKEYYRDALSTIHAMCVDYDGFRTVKGLKSLVDDIDQFAKNAHSGKKLYLGIVKENKELK